MPGPRIKSGDRLWPGIHDFFRACGKVVDGRAKRDHDEKSGSIGYA